MAFVNYNLAEVVWRIVGRKEVGRPFFRINIEGLISGDMDSSVAGMVPAFGVLVNFRRVGSEGVLQGPERLRAQLVTVTDKERPPKSAGIGNFPENLNGDKRLARAGGQRKSSSLGLSR